MCPTIGGLADFNDIAFQWQLKCTLIKGRLKADRPDRGLKLKRNKTKVMKFEKAKDRRKLNVKLGNDNLEEVVDFTNLGSKFTNDNLCSQDIKCGLALAKKSVCR